ncbi:MAG: Crp/Fnr family transcriptional regulator [Chloroflexi bacterium]|nr:Crp/Fnr family transcriptional regulator [Chloroflexota bacterium]
MLKTLYRNPLASIPCFSSLDGDASRVVMVSLQETPYRKEEVIFFEGDPCPGLFIVKSGRVKLYRSSPNGDEHIVRVLGPSGCFECAPLFDGGPNPVSAQAMEDCILYFLPAQAFHAILTNPEVTMSFVRVLALRLRGLLNQVEDMSFRTVRARLARLLLQMSGPAIESVAEAPLTLLNQHQLACMLGCTRQMVNSSLGSLAREGIIRKDGRRIVILKPDELKRMVEEA